MMIVSLLDGTEARFNPEAASVLARDESWTLYRSRTGRFVVVDERLDTTTAYEIQGSELLEWIEEAEWLSSEMQEMLAAARDQLPEI